MDKLPWPMCPEHDTKMTWGMVGFMQNAVMAVMLMDVGRFSCPVEGCGWTMEGNREDFDENNPKSCAKEYLEATRL